MYNLRFILAWCLAGFFPLLLPAQQFTITGTTEGLPDGTWIYLKKASPQIPIDSAQVTQGRFTLKGKINEKAEQALLHTAKFSNYVIFWLEAVPMQVHLKNGAFKQARFSGSATQLENEKLRNIIDPLRHREDSLSNLLSTNKDSDVKNVIRTKIEAINRDERATYIDFVATHPHSIIAANILKIYASTWGKEKTQELYEKLSPEIKSSTYGRDIDDYLTLAQDIRVGGKYADFEQTDTEGKPVKLSAIKAKYILLEFWGSWCGPCRAENPNLVKTYQAYQPKGFEILGVAADDNKAQWLQAVKQDKLPWTNVCDLKGDQNKAVLIYGINAFPTNFLIDENGIIIAKNLRGDDLRKKLAELLP